LQGKEGGRQGGGGRVLRRNSLTSWNRHLGEKSVEYSRVLGSKLQRRENARRGQPVLNQTERPKGIYAQFIE
jgi:hypothetical protein